jgi:type IV pilus assembly protein PilC
MKVFRTKYITSQGRTRRNRVWADDSRSAHAALRAQGNYPIQIIEESTVNTGGLKKYNTRLSSKEVIAMLDQLEMQLDADIPIDEALRNLAKDFPDGKARFVVSRILERVAVNGRIAEAFGQFPKIFPLHIVHIIDVGHQTGTLTASFGKIAAHLNATDEIKGVIKKAISYPIISFFIILCVAVFLLGFVLPMFGKVFFELGVKLPLVTRIYVSSGAFVQAHFLLVVALSFGGPLLIWQLMRFRAVKEGIDQVLVRTPIVHEIVQFVVISRMAGNLHALYEAGIPIQDAVKLCAKITGNSVYDQALQQALDRIVTGSGLGDSLATTKRFPGMMTLSIKVGEQTGYLGKAFDKIHRYYSRRSREKVSIAIQFLEPMMTVGMGLFLGSVAVSLFYPLVTLAMNLK